LSLKINKVFFIVQATALENFAGTNALAYFDQPSVMKNSLMTLTPGNPEKNR
jgi:hypothetical protein